MAKFKQKDIQEAVNIKREDESRKKIKECAEEIEKVLSKYNCTITPMLQILDQSFENAIINKALKEKGEVIKK